VAGRDGRRRPAGRGLPPAGVTRGSRPVRAAPAAVRRARRRRSAPAARSCGRGRGGACRCRRG
jgi:hypothetical protein